MFKKLVLFLVLVIALVAGPIGGGVMAAENGQTCTLLAEVKVIQIMPDGALMSVVTPGELPIKIGAEIDADMVANLNRQSTGSNAMDWTGGNMGLVEFDFGQGPVPLMLVVKDIDVRDCK